MNSKINILFAVGLFLGCNLINGMQPTKPKFVILDRINKLEQAVRELNKARPCLSRLCPDLEF